MDHSRFDVAIVGGGIIGMACAEALSRRGATVCIIEKDHLGRAASWAGGGMLTPLPPDQPVSEGVKSLLAESLALYPEWCARLQRESGIDPEYWECGADFYKRDGRHIEYPRMAQVRNPRLVKALISTLQRRGVALYEERTALGWLEADGRLHGVRTDRGDIAAQAAVVAAGAWSGSLGADGVGPAKGQMLLLRGEPGQLSRLLIGEDGYLIPRRDGHILVGSTIEDAGFDVSTTEAARAQLLERAARLWPDVTTLPLIQQWAGLRPRPQSDAPLLGPHPSLSGLWLATGHFRIGLTLAPGTAERIAHQIAL